MHPGKPGPYHNFSGSANQVPENLGVGKPYDYMIDSRLENFVEARIRTGMGKDEQAVALRKQVAGYAVSQSRFESGNFLTAIALRELGDTVAADNLVASWAQKYPDNKVAQWCTAIYNGDTGKAASLLSTRNNQADTTPWEMSGRDMDFDLIVRLFSR